MVPQRRFGRLIRLKTKKEAGRWLSFVRLTVLLILNLILQTARLVA